MSQKVKSRKPEKSHLWTLLLILLYLNVKLHNKVFRNIIYKTNTSKAVFQGQEH